MKRLGIAGGLGPESTIEYYREILAGVRARVPDAGSPPVVIDSLDALRFLEWMTAGQLDSVADCLVASFERLACAGAALGLIAANTPHVVFDAVQRRSPIPLVSIVEAACEAARAAGIMRVALLGTRFTMLGRFYPEVFERQGPALCIPQPVEVETIHRIYVDELLRNEFRPASRLAVLEVVDRMLDRDDIQGVILGGTELPLLLREGAHRGIPLLDTTRIHAASAVDRMLS